MTMRLISRNDTSLVVGLIAGTVVVFQRPLRGVWTLAVAVQNYYQVDLVPALMIFVGVLLFHEARKRQRTRAEAAIASAEAALERQRSAQLERLRAFAQALANALDRPALQQCLWEHLPPLLGARSFWVLARRGDRWEALVLPATEWGEAERNVDTLADGALDLAAGEPRGYGVAVGDTICFPMTAAGRLVGVLGIDAATDLSRGAREALGAATVFVASAVRNVELLLDMRDHSVRDALTGCFNRGHGLEMLGRDLQLANRRRRPLSIVMFDIDRFKLINDQFGHQRGDEVLRSVAAQLTRVLRASDLKCRYGGDEFLVILADTPRLGAQQVAESLRRQIESLTVVTGERTMVVTASIGVATAELDEGGIETLIQRADDALYQAKRGGRNRVCALASAEAAPVTVP